METHCLQSADSMIDERLTQANSFFTESWRTAVIKDLTVIPKVDIYAIIVNGDSSDIKKTGLTNINSLIKKQTMTVTQDTIPLPFQNIDPPLSTFSLQDFKNSIQYQNDSVTDANIYIDSVEDMYTVNTDTFALIPFESTQLEEKYPNAELYYLTKIQEYQVVGRLHTQQLYKPQPVQVTKTTQIEDLSLPTNVNANNSDRSVAVEYKYTDDEVQIRGLPSTTEATPSSQLTILQRKTQSAKQIFKDITNSPYTKQELHKRLIAGFVTLFVLSFVLFSWFSFYIHIGLTALFVATTSELYFSAGFSQFVRDELVYTPYDNAEIIQFDWNLPIVSHQPESRRNGVTQTTESVTVELVDNGTKLIQKNSMTDEPLVWELGETGVAPQSVLDFFVEFGWENTKETFTTRMTTQPESLPYECPTLESTTGEWYLLPS